MSPRDTFSPPEDALGALASFLLAEVQRRRQARQALAPAAADPRRPPPPDIRGNATRVVDEKPASIQ
jgi:hypothetical protein